jgi:transcriptional regulator with XRE-family HTH domain
MSLDTTANPAGSQGAPSDLSDAIFARRLREVRLLAGVTQQQLADRMTAVGHKMHRSAIAKIEVGDRPVSIGEAVQLAGQLGTTLMDLVIDARSGSREDRVYRERVEAMIRVRSSQHEAAERHKYLEEAQVLYDTAIERLKAAEHRLAELGGGVAWDDAPSIERTLAAQSIPLVPGANGP